MVSIVDENLIKAIEEIKKTRAKLVGYLEAKRSFEGKLAKNNLPVWLKDKYLRQKEQILKKIEEAGRNESELQGSVAIITKTNGNGNGNGAKGGSGAVF